MAGTLVARKLANALSMTAALRPEFRSTMRWRTLGVRDLADRWLRKQNGGATWVGGTLLVFDDRVQFEANALNKFLQTGLKGFDLAWREVSEIGWRPAILTSIIELRHGDQVEAVRCFGSKRLAEQMKSLRAANVSKRLLNR